MAGSFRDPMVGRDLLIGATIGLAHSSIIALGGLATSWFGINLPPPMTSNPIAFMGMRFILGAFLNGFVVLSIFVGFAFLFVLLLLFIILRRNWLAALVMFLLVAVVEVAAFATSRPIGYVLGSLAIAFLVVTVVAKFGLLATMSFQLVFFITMAYPLTADLTSWFASSTYFAITMILGLAIYGFYTSLGGQRIFAGNLLKDD